MTASSPTWASIEWGVCMSWRAECMPCPERASQKPSSPTPFPFLVSDMVPPLHACSSRRVHPEQCSFLFAARLWMLCCAECILHCPTLRVVVGPPASRDHRGIRAVLCTARVVHGHWSLAPGQVGSGRSGGHRRVRGARLSSRLQVAGSGHQPLGHLGWPSGHQSCRSVWQGRQCTWCMAVSMACCIGLHLMSVLSSSGSRWDAGPGKRP